MTRVLGPLVRGSTYRRGVHLLLGAVILLPYALLATAFAQLAAGPAATLVLLVPTLAIVGVPAFLGGTRSLEIAAARALLDVDLPDPPPSRGDGGAAARIPLETRVRGALWFGVHLLAGGAVGAGLLVALPMALVFVAQLFGVATEEVAEFRFGPLDGRDTGPLTAVGLAVLVGLVYAVAGLGALVATLAPVLLGPSPQERIAALEARASALAERNRLARELHDSVGHALTVTTLQAAAARELLDTDPEFARRALTAIEDTGRGAMAELDYVLGVLRESASERAPQPTLADLAQLVAGVDVAVRVDGTLDDLPVTVSREAYRIVQEGLTNAARHAPRAPVTLRLAVARDELDIALANPVTGRAAARRGGRGLAGMRERVALLGGEFAAGPADGAWRVTARLPLRGSR
ncbi:histidine kinase [Actinomycetes bacterium KLBMP 9797]